MTVKPIVSWFEIPVVDLDRAINFYVKALRLKIEKVEMMGIPMGLFHRETGIGGVLVLRPVPREEVTTLYFSTTDISSTLERIENLGGEIILKKTILKLSTETGQVMIARSFIDNETGYIAKFRDSEGNIMGLHSNS